MRVCVSLCCFRFFHDSLPSTKIQLLGPGPHHRPQPPTRAPHPFSVPSYCARAHAEFSLSFSWPHVPLIFCPVTSVSCVKIYLAQLSSTLCELPCLSREELIVPSAWLLDVCPFSPLVAFLRYVIIVCFPLHFSHQTEGQEWCLILLCSLVRCLLPVRWIGPSCTVP